LIITNLPYSSRYLLEYFCIFGEHLAILSLGLAVAVVVVVVIVFLAHSSVCNMKTLYTFAISVLPAEWLKMEESHVLNQAKT
jgi:hypothetical protein